MSIDGALGGGHAGPRSRVGCLRGQRRLEVFKEIIWGVDHDGMGGGEGGVTLGYWAYELRYTEWPEDALRVKARAVTHGARRQG